MRSLIFGLMTVSVLILAGCADDDDTNPPPAPSQVQVSVSVNPDTMWFVYGDAVLAEITVLVADADGHPLADKPVVVHVSDPDIGEVDFEFMGGDHSTTRDTTDSEGRALIPYLAVRSGDNLITAVSEGDTAYTTAVQRYPYDGTGLSMMLMLLPSDWDFRSRPDTVMIEVDCYVHDEFGHAVPGLNLHFAAQRGHLSAEYAVTNSGGLAQVWLTGVENDFFVDDISPEMAVEVNASIGAFSDAALVNFRR